MNKLTKTDFIHFLNCPNSLWLKKNKAENYDEFKGELNDFLKRLIADGYEIEEYAKKLFPNGLDILPTFNDDTDFQETKKLLTGDIKTFFQPTFITPEGLFARADILQKNSDGSFDIYEVKSSTKIKKDKKHNHLKDVCFQKYTMEKLGYVVKNSFIIHLDSNFKKDGEIDETKLLIKEEVNEEVEKLFDKTVREIEEALAFINKDKINENICPCFEKTRSNHCDTFMYFNKDWNKEYIHNFNRISEKKIKELLEMGVEKIVDVPDDFELSEKQIIQKESMIIQKPIINQMEIEKTLNALEFPLYFFDYETIPSAIPKVEGFSPHQHLPFQFSLHILHKNGELEHREYLAEKFEKPEKLILFMKEVIGKTGHLISWFASFEKTQNKKMMEMFPEHQEFLEDINNRTFDLMDIFKVDYIDYKFNGSTSIKKVLPVLVPELSYEGMEVENGAAAIEQGEKMLEMEDGEERREIRKNLLAYCELDTFAMVEIYRKLLKP